MSVKMVLSGKLSTKRDGSNLIFPAGVVSSLKTIFSKAQVRCGGKKIMVVTIEPTSLCCSLSNPKSSHNFVFYTYFTFSPLM